MDDMEEEMNEPFALEMALLISPSIVLGREEGAKCKCGAALGRRGFKITEERLTKGCDGGRRRAWVDDAAGEGKEGDNETIEVRDGDGGLFGVGMVMG